MTSIRRLEIRVDQTGDAEKGIKSISGSVGSIAKVGLAAGAAALGGIALLTGAVLGLGSKLTGLGGSAEEMESKFNTVFGISAPEATRQLDEFGNAAGRNKFALMEMASTMQDTFVPLGFAREQAANLALAVTELAVDVGSFNNTLAPQVMEDFQSAIIGNHETVRKYGIIITQVTLDQELLNMGVAGGVKEATEMEKAQARLNIIYAGTTDAQGDAIRTAGSWTNQMLSLKEAFTEGATEMGLFLNQALLPLLSEFGPWVKDLMPRAVEIFKRFAENLGGTVFPALTLVKDAVIRIAEAFGIQTQGVSSADVVLKAFEMSLGAIVTAIQLVAIGFQIMAAGVEAVRHGVGTIVFYFDRMREAAIKAVAAIPDWLRPGSPTPFEVGLKGINQAAKDIDLSMGMAGMGKRPAVAEAGRPGGTIVNVNLTYSPVISLADQYEAQEKLTPFILGALRTAGVTP